MQSTGLIDPIYPDYLILGKKISQYIQLLLIRSAFPNLPDLQNQQEGCIFSIQRAIDPCRMLLYLG